jgi:crossover junction endodeoxyribonuclease RuvC
VSESVRILGFDPGTRVAGWGLVDAEAGRPARVVACGAVRLEKYPFPERLSRLHDALAEVIARHRPGVFAVESVFHGKSFASVLKVGEARGVGLLAAARAGLEVAEFPPAEVKKSATGNGRATKTQMQAMMARLLRLDAAPRPADVADALALALCYAQRLWRRRLPPRRPTAAALLLKTYRKSLTGR